MNKHGLIDRDIKYMIEAFNKYEEIQQVIIFGSRAMGNYKKSSDVDIAINGLNVTREILLSLSDDLNEVYPLPYYFDIIDYNQISNDSLKNHVDTEGYIIYESLPGAMNKI